MLEGAGDGVLDGDGVGAGVAALGSEAAGDEHPVRIAAAITAPLQARARVFGRDDGTVGVLQGGRWRAGSLSP
ncbi:hypothetical protein GCM10010988_25100 [Cnuibacter physcomitrellae]|nr:hypothetical protein GCM10010988_25100 [Cnuibacter physcomitrellae]